ncbi:MAG: hypothetical protein LUI87_18775 [Lachnospiraceae bacterium]|nr:hypothetical protein [Lachnospiraceae bacterium]
MNHLKAGAGRCEIHFPATMFPTDGFMGVHDAPQVRMLMLESGSRMVIAVLELVNVPEDILNMVRDMIAGKTGTPRENIWLHVNHNITTPHAPRDPAVPFPPFPKETEEEKKRNARNAPPEDPEAPRKRREFMAAVREAAAAALDRMLASFTEARMGVGTGFCDVNSNRDVETPAGWWIHINREGISNKTATVVRLDSMDGKPIGMLINYGLKPSTIDNSEKEKNTRLISADVTGFACTALEEKYGAPVMFTMSAAGDQVPREQALLEVVREDGSVEKIDQGVEKGLEMVSRLGREMASDMEAIIDKIECSPLETPVKYASTSIFWKGKKRSEMRPTRKPEYIPEEEEREMDAHALVLEDLDLAFVAIKPETNAVTELQLKEKSPYKHTLLMSMVNGGMRYVPDQSAFEKGTWEALSSALMPGAAEAWVEKTVKMLSAVKEKGAET